jgi:hypothetical protein
VDEIEQLTSAEYADEPFPVTQIVLTNYPHHYGHPLGRDPPTDHLGVGFVNPAYPFANPAITDAIRDALESYGTYPSPGMTLTRTSVPIPTAPSEAIWAHVVRCVPCFGL